MVRTNNFDKMARNQNSMKVMYFKHNFKYATYQP